MSSNFIKIPPNFEKKDEVVEERKKEEKPRVMSWGVINGCDFIYKSNKMLCCVIDGKRKVIYQYAEPDKVTELKDKFELGEITKEDLISGNYGD